MSRYERVLFTQNEQDAGDFFLILEHDGASAALDHLAQWHNPGEHETESEPSHGRDDQVYMRDGYTMSWNRALGYCALEFDTEPTCQWFAGCDNAATGSAAHPILGNVPTCDRCHARAT